jgi:hypothetical protein
MKKFKIIPLTLSEANYLVGSLHRHHKPVQGHRFSLGLMKDDLLCGAVIVGRPVSRYVDYTKIVEVTRLVTDGSEHACSALYGAAARVAKEMGFEEIRTYILEEEPGTSLKASGWVYDGMAAPSRFHLSRKDGIEREPDTLGAKQRWIKRFPELIPNLLPETPIVFPEGV